MHKIKSKALWVNPNLEMFMDITSTPAPPHVHQPLFTPCVVFTHALVLVCLSRPQSEVERPQLRCVMRVYQSSTAEREMEPCNDGSPAL